VIIIHLLKPRLDNPTFTYGEAGKRIESEGYEPKDCRILKNWQRQGKGGFDTQRNGLSYTSNSCFATVLTCVKSRQLCLVCDSKVYPKPDGLVYTMPLFILQIICSL